MWDWLNCIVLFRHEYGTWCEDGVIFLRCLRCGHRSRGWEVDPAIEARRAQEAAARTHRRFPIIGRLWAPGA